MERNHIENKPIALNGDSKHNFSFAEKADISSFYWFKIEALGFGREVTDNADGSSQSVSELSKAASLFASVGIPFSLLCTRKTKQEKIIFAIGCPQKKIIPVVLQAAFGITRYKHYEYDESQYPFSYNACSFEICKTDCDEIVKKKPLKDIQISEWVDETAKALFSCPGMIRLDFYPITKRNDSFSKMIKSFEKDYDKIGEYLETNITFTNNDADASTPGIVKKVQSIFGETIKQNSSLGWSVSSKKTDSYWEKKKKSSEYYSNLFECSMKEGWVIDFSAFSYSDIDREDSISALIVPISAAITNAGYTCSWEHYDVKEEEKKAGRGLVLPVPMAMEFVSFPTSSFYGFERITNKFYCVNLPELRKDETNNNNVQIAEMLQFNEPTGISVALPSSQLNRHVFVCGMTGSGKTNTVHQLLSNVGDLPYLVIEPVKGEYHSLPGVETYTMTAGSTQAFYNNPFWFPQGSNLQYHIDCLKQIISSAFDLYAAMPNILEQCLTLIYQHSGWDLVTGKNYYANELPEKMLYPTFSDLCREIEKYLDNSKFSAENKGDYQGALLSRLQSFTTGSKGMMLNTIEHASYEYISSKKVVISLDSLADDADKSIVMGVILAQYFQFLKVRSAGQKKKGLKHLTVIEEAHHLFSGDTQSQSSGSREGGSASSTQAFVKTLNNMLAEIRAYGEGFIIVDQSPSALHPSVLKNTATKIAHRIDYGQDIESLRDVLLLEKDDNELAMLEQGDALIRFERMRSPVKAHVSKCMTKEESDILMSEEIEGNSILSHLLEDDEMKRIVLISIEKLLQQLLFDDLSSMKEAYDVYISNIRKALVIYGHYEIVTNENNKELISEYSSALFQDVLRKMLPSQYLSIKLIAMYASKFLQIATESDNRISDNEIFAFDEYRKKRIWSRLNRFFEHSRGKAFVIENEIIGICPEIGLIRRIISAYFSSKEKNERKIEELIKFNFLINPAPSCFFNLLDKIDALLKSKEYISLFVN